MYVWDERRDAELTAFWGNGLTSSEIASRLGCVSRNAVIGRAHRLGLSKKSQRKLPPNAPRPRGGNMVPRARARETARKNLAAKLPNLKKTLDSGKQIDWGKMERAFDAAAIPDTPDLPPLLVRRTFEQLETNDCRFPVGDPRSPDFGFCGLPRDPEHPSYCPDCRKRAKAPPAPRKALPPIPLPRMHVNV